MFSFGSFLFITSTNKNKILEQIELLRSLEGLQHVEIWWEHGEWTDDNTKWLREQLGDWQCIMHAPSINFTFVSTHKEQNEASLSILKQKVDQARILKARVFTFHAGTRVFYINDEQAREICAPYIKELIQHSRNELKISIENLPKQGGAFGGYPTNGQEVVRLLGLVPNLFTTLDVGHSYKSNDDYLTFIRNDSDKIANIHFHNTNEEGVEHFGFNKPGGIEPQKVIQVLKEADYQGYLTLEIVYDEDTRKSWDIIRSIV